jgi:hypothetical protein
VADQHPDGENSPTQVRCWPRRSDLLFGRIDCSAVELLCGLGATQSAPLGTGCRRSGALRAGQIRARVSSIGTARASGEVRVRPPSYTQPKETSLTKKLTLSTRVALDQGHALFTPIPDWTGSTEQFWAATPARDE